MVTKGCSAYDVVFQCCNTYTGASIPPIVNGAVTPHLNSVPLRGSVAVPFWCMYHVLLREIQDHSLLIVNVPLNVLTVFFILSTFLFLQQYMLC